LCIRAGALLPSVDFSTVRIACAATQALMRSRDGLPIPKNIVLTAELIYRSMVEALRVPPAERSCPP
jgi:hypothetical protein